MNNILSAANFRRMADTMEALAAAAAEHLAKLKDLQGMVIDSKNAADAGETAKNGTDGIWSHVFALGRLVEDQTKDGLESDRETLFTGLLADFIIPKNDDAGKPLKLSTVGQYASSCRKALLAVTATGESLAKFEGMGVAEVRKSFRNVSDIVLLEGIAEAAKQLRYIVKHGSEAGHAEVKEALELIAATYRPIKAATDAKSKKGQAAVGLPELQQQPPAEAGTVETVADSLADAGEPEPEEIKQAVNE